VRAAVLRRPGPLETGPRLVFEERTPPEPGPEQVLLRVQACGVCHTDLHVVEGELPPRVHPVVPGHQIVGRVGRLGLDADPTLLGRRVGVGWLGWTDGTCPACHAGQENLCERARFTGYHFDGGYAEYACAAADFVHLLPEDFGAAQAAPLLCAGVVGYRALRLSGAGAGTRLGLYGFGASAHLVLQVARHLGCQVLVFTRSPEHRRLALELGAAWAGGAEEHQPPGGPLQAAIIFAPAGGLVPLALRALNRGGTLVLAGIYMSPIPSLPYDLLWHERVVRSVANGTRQDARDLLALAYRIPLRVEVQEHPLDQVNEVLAALKAGRIRGAAVLRIGAAE
jgi:propanol-preferring alcohol dehydrogenase